MANILRYSPADDTFDDLFRGFFMRPVTFEGPQVNQPRKSSQPTNHRQIAAS